MSTTTLTSTDAYELRDTFHEPSVAFRYSNDVQRPTSTRISKDSRSASGREPPRSAEYHHDSIHEAASLVTGVQRTITPSVTLKPFRINLIILQVSFINFLASLSTGIVVVGLPHIAEALALPERLYLWPSSVFSLTTGSTLLLAGAIADVVGPRTVDLIGCFTAGIFTLACGVSRNGIELVMFRALQGIGMAMHYPCSVSLISKFLPSGKKKNIAFACLGLAMPLGYSVGLVLGGVLINTIGWRVGFYIPGAIMLAQTGVAFRLIPTNEKTQNVWSKLANNVDWVGAMIACASLAMFSYVLAIVSTDSNNIRQPSTVALLVVSVLLMLLFPMWMRRQEKRGRPALIPNSLWKNLPFTTVCVLTILVWGVQNSMELFSSLYFQEVQAFSPFEASLRLLPSLIVGAALNLSTGYFIDRASPFWLILVSTILTAGAPLLMALIKPAWPYWWGAFPAQVLAPLCGDIFFTVGLIIVSDVFPEGTQALAGAVFNTVAFFGWSFGINIMQVVSLLVTKGTSYRDKSSPPALLLGYQASFWAMFAAMLASAVVGVFGLRNVTKVGLKRE